MGLFAKQIDESVLKEKIDIFFKPLYSIVIEMKESFSKKLNFLETSMHNFVEEIRDNISANVSDIAILKEDVSIKINKQERDIDNINIGINKQEKNIEELLKIVPTIKQSLIDFYEIKDKMDDSIVLWSTDKLKKHISSRLDSFESSVDTKILALNNHFDEKLSLSNGNRKNVVSLMKRIAQLEGISDSKENRRSTEEILERRTLFESKVQEMDRKDTDYSRYSDAIQILNWVLGEGGQNG